MSSGKQQMKRHGTSPLRGPVLTGHGQISVRDLGIGIREVKSSHDKIPLHITRRARI